jgi:hypothetical protein
MKYSFAVLAFAAIATAQQSSIPAGAQPCIAAAVASATTCGASDLACQCTTANEAAIQSAATSCVLNKCSSTDAASTSPPLKHQYQDQTLTMYRHPDRCPSRLRQPPLRRWFRLQHFCSPSFLRRPSFVFRSWWRRHRDHLGHCLHH